MKDRPLRAAQYVRMSTDHQKYSTENQAEVIAAFAQKEGLTIVRTFEDSGKSGLTLDDREALQDLLEVVQSGQADFEFVLVYDVSRWGRFQTPNDGVFYETLCKRAGVPVLYCAEEFQNDGSMVADLLRAVKGHMAAAYSKFLSSNVFNGQKNLIKRGYRQGGSAGYGLRRQLIDESGTRKGDLKRRERKSLQTDRVILVPGPANEVAIVRRIYEQFIEQRLAESEIAERLNAEGIPGEDGRAWTRGIVRQILTNEKYIGNNIFNRVSFKLKKKPRKKNPPEEWVRRDGAFEPIVDPKAFARVREIILERHRRVSDDEMLEKLRALLGQHGRLSGLLIDEAEGMPSSAAYSHRFGSLLRAYERISYDPGRDYAYVEINRRRLPLPQPPVIWARDR